MRRTAAWRSAGILSQNVKLRLWFPRTKSAREQGERGAVAFRSQEDDRALQNIKVGNDSELKCTF